MSIDTPPTDLHEYRLRKQLRHPNPRVISVTGGKGGVGKSIVAVNLAAATAAAGQRVLAIDADLGMADLNLLLGVAPHVSLLDVVEGCEVQDALIQAHGLSLLPALNGSYQLANMNDDVRTRVFSAIDQLRDDFDAVVIDTPAGIDDNAVAFAAAGSHTVLVLTPEPVSLADAYACLKALSVRRHITQAYVLPNGVTSQTQAEDVFARLCTIVDRFLGISLEMLPWIPHDPTVPAASALGRPLVLEAPDSPAARALKQVAARLATLDSVGAAPAWMRLFGGRARAEETNA
jgi:flagellar biosynthesis protein FlhG